MKIEFLKLFQDCWNTFKQVFMEGDQLLPNYIFYNHYINNYNIYAFVTLNILSVSPLNCSKLYQSNFPITFQVINNQIFHLFLLVNLVLALELIFFLQYFIKNSSFRKKLVFLVFFFREFL